MEIKRPIELAGLKSRLLRAQQQEAKIADTGKRYDKVLDSIDELTAAHVVHVGHLEHHAGDLAAAIERMVGSNRNPNASDGQSGQQSGSEDGHGQIITSETIK